MSRTQKREEAREMRDEGKGKSIINEKLAISNLRWIGRELECITLSIRTL
ncbi:MAG: hypothetical protein U9R01_06350 [candidate division WOR-3 bacterium]|nr:hypothetical protein [candidate division WOR-3 bacterium]